MSKTVLIVDDDLDFQAQLGHYLGTLGYGVLTAADAAGARELFAARKPDVAVVDLMLEHLDDGFLLCHHFKQVAPAVPIIMVTAVTHETGFSFDAETAEERSWIKADALLQKPVRMEALREEILRLAGEKGTQ